jgi:hypothetical protein
MMGNRSEDCLEVGTAVRIIRWRRSREERGFGNVEVDEHEDEKGKEGYEYEEEEGETLREIICIVHICVRTVQVVCGRRPVTTVPPRLRAVVGSLHVT